MVTIINSSDLENLKKEECELVDRIREKLRKKDGKCRVAYLPNAYPSEKVKYILVAQEPSLGGWAKTKNCGEVDTVIKNGFRNFSLSIADHILHYLTRTCLENSYYITDISKAAMSVKDADQYRNEFSDNWEKLLIAELNLIGDKDCQIIPIGRRTEKILNQIEKDSIHGLIKPALPHYSSRNRHLLSQAAIFKNDFDEFKKEYLQKWDDLLENAKRIVNENGNIIEQQRVLNKLESDHKLSDTRLAQWFLYEQQFKSLNVRRNPR